MKLTDGKDFWTEKVPVDLREAFYYFAWPEALTKCQRVIDDLLAKHLGCNRSAQMTIFNLHSVFLEVP